MVRDSSSSTMARISLCHSFKRPMARRFSKSIWVCWGFAWRPKLEPRWCAAASRSTARPRLPTSAVLPLPVMPPTRVNVHCPGEGLEHAQQEGPQRPCSPLPPPGNPCRPHASTAVRPASEARRESSTGRRSDGGLRTRPRPETRASRASLLHELMALLDGILLALLLVEDADGLALVIIQQRQVLRRRKGTAPELHGRSHIDQRDVVHEQAGVGIGILANRLG